MNIKKFEEMITKSIVDVVERIITTQIELSISAKARAGAEISDYFEKQFVKYSANSDKLRNAEGSPDGMTKNPWDARVVFTHKNVKEEIWIDFKALKITGADSNPDIGTPNKILKFISEGYFYLLYVYVYYEETAKGLKFVKHDNSFTKAYFLKDIHHSFRRNPKNQLQVNMSEEPEYRTREEFINLLVNKIEESHKRQIKISEKCLKELENVRNKLIEKNKISESSLIKKI